MNRRDTIIIAVLLNAGVLAILFMLAIHDGQDDAYSQPSPSLVYQEQITNPTPIAIASAGKEEYIEFSMDDPFQAAEEPQPIEQYRMASIDPAIPEMPKPLQPKPPTTPKIPAEPTAEIIVKRGDSLDKLARNNGTTIEDIKSLNQLKSDMLTVGQVLRMPAAKKAPTAAQKNSDIAQASQSPKKTDGQGLTTTQGAVYYTMKTGDSPWKIARQHQMNLDDLLLLNQLDEAKARNLKVGDKIRIK